MQYRDQRKCRKKGKGRESRKEKQRKYTVQKEELKKKR